MAKFQIDLNVLNHLGLSLYTNTPAVLTEIVSNAWDADATEVHINIDTEKNRIIIKDNGHGMNELDIEGKFLKVGYARRRDNRDKSPNGRQVMGRKGIGKLAMFSLADTVDVYTKTVNDEIISLRVNVPNLQKAIKNGTEYNTENINCTDIDFSGEQGTYIVLSDIHKNINKTASYLKKHLARRFSILGKAFDFRVYLNDNEVTLLDRGYTSKLEFIWSFGDLTEQITSNASKIEKIDNNLPFSNENFTINGFIGSVKTPSDLKDDDVSNNAITILANGRIFQENILDELDNAKIFTSYLVGEINADFLDATKFDDMAISSRQGLRQNDPRYQALKTFLEHALKQVDRQWEEWRIEEGAKDVEKNPVLQNWLNSLSDKRDKEAAKKLIGKINTVRFSGDKDIQELSKKEVLKNAVLAFEKLKIRGNLDRLDKLSSFNVEAFKPILDSIDDIEESYFYDITKQRLGIIEKFENLVDENQKEKIIQEYLYQHLWLLDPSWERTTAETEIERTVTKEIKEIEPDSTGARIDIAYKTISGKYIIIEMKRPDVKTSFDDLISQGRKYIKAVNRWYVNHPNQIKPNALEVYFIIGNKGQEKVQEDIDYNNQYSGVNYTRDQLSSISGQIFTYNDLITQSRQVYSDYLNSKKEIEKIKLVLDSI